MKQETIPERAEEALSRRLAELPVQQMPESLKQDIVRRTERTVRRRKRTGKVWRATAVAVGGAALCLLGGRTLVVLGPDLRTLLQRCSRYACGISIYTPSWRVPPHSLPSTLQ